jgi:hypothetical protein
MRKIRLKIDELVVESMDTVAAPPRGGTVRAMMSGDGGACYTLGVDPTCAHFASCDVHVECEGTVVNPSCPNVTGC